MAHTETTEGTGEGVRDAFRAAFADAVKEHAPAPDAGEVETEGEGTDGDETPTVETPTPEGKPAPVESKPAKAGELITDEEYTALEAKHKGDAVALRKSLEAVFTKKTQAIASERASLERLSQYRELIDAYEEDPHATIQRLASLNGLELVEPGQAPTRAATTTAAAEPTTEERNEAFLTKFRERLGPELEYLADSVGPALLDAMQDLLPREMEKVVQPLRASTEAMLNDRATAVTETVMKTFGDSHPDWKEHEAEMTALAKQLDPKGMDELTYLDTLYKVVTRDKWEAAKEENIERDVAGRFKKRLDKMNNATTDDANRTIPEDQIRKRPPGPVDFAQAFKDAKAGIRYDD